MRKSSRIDAACRPLQRLHEPRSIPQKLITPHGSDLPPGIQRLARRCRRTPSASRSWSSSVGADVAPKRRLARRLQHLHPHLNSFLSWLKEEGHLAEPLKLKLLPCKQECTGAVLRRGHPVDPGPTTSSSRQRTVPSTLNRLCWPIRKVEQLTPAENSRRKPLRPLEGSRFESAGGTSRWRRRIRGGGLDHGDPR